MTFNANQWYTARDLARAGIRNDQALQLLVARGVVEAQCDGYSESYLGKSLLLAIDAGKIRVGEPIELSSGKRAAARPTPTRPVAKSVATVQLAKPPRSLQARYATMHAAWRAEVDRHMKGCCGDRVRATLAANRSFPGLAGRVSGLHRELQEEKAAADSPERATVGAARREWDRLIAAETERNGGDRCTATRTVVRKHPKAHERFVVEANERTS